MIVVDTNVISYLLLPTPHTEVAERVYQADPNWAAPVPWRSELRHVLALYLRKGLLSLEQALGLQERAEDLLHGNEFQVTSATLLALAQELGVSLVTADKALLKAFPDRTRTIAGFG